MPLTFGSNVPVNASGQSQPTNWTVNQGMPGTTQQDPTNNGNPWLGLLGAGLGVASQFGNGPLAPGATQAGTLPWMQNQWQNVFGQQNTAAGRTSDQAVAGLTPAQLQAMQNIQGSVGLGMGDLQTAQNNASGLAGGIGAPQVQNFFNPFQQSAVAGTLGTMEQQRNVQNAQTDSAARAAGAWGGDRSAVADSLNNQAWDLAEGNVVGNLNNAGYQNAVQSALGNQAGQLAGNAQLQQAILNRINTNMGQNQALLGVGNQQQQQAQNVANWPILQGQIMGQNLNANVGSRSGTLQNPISGTIAGLQGGLQFGNSLSSLLFGNGQGGQGGAGVQNPSGLVNQIRQWFNGSGGGAPGVYDPSSSVFNGAPGQTSVDWGMGGGGGGDVASGAGDASQLLDSNGNLISGLGFSPAGGEAAASGAGAIGDVAGGGAGAAGAGLFTPGAAAGGGGIDTMALAQQGYASLGGVPGSLAAADTSAGGAGAGAGVGLGTAALGIGAILGLPLLGMSGAFGNLNPNNSGWQYASPGQIATYLSGGHLLPSTYNPYLRSG